jgi:hypothetical protein
MSSLAENRVQQAKPLAITSHHDVAQKGLRAPSERLGRGLAARGQLGCRLSTPINALGRAVFNTGRYRA